MSKRVRPVTPLNLPRLKFSGSARRLGDFQRVQGGGRIDLPAMRLLGNANKHGQTGNRFANGTATLPKLKMGSGAALAIRRSKGQGISQMPLRGVALIGSVLRIDSEAATVQLFNASGNPSGVGPSSDPEGVFYGDTSLVAGDVWWADQVPTNCTVTTFPGGSFTVVATAAVATGPYQFRVNLRRGINGVRSAFMKDFVVSTSQIYVNAANPSAGAGTIGNPYKTIQAAATASTNGAAVLVAPGTYAEQVTAPTSNVYYLATGGAPGVFPATVDGGLTRGNGFLANSKNLLIDGFKITQTTADGISVRGPSITALEIRNCWTYNTGGSGIGIWGVPFGVDPTPSSYRGVQNLRIHHCVVELACNDVIGGGFNEEITVANGIFNFAIHHNRVGPSLNVAGVYSSANGGEGIDLKCGAENPVGVAGLGIFNNEVVSIERHGIYIEAGHCATGSGYTTPAVMRNIHVYNNLTHGIKAHGITVNAEVSSDSVADPATGRQGGQLRGIYVDYNTSYGNDDDGILIYDYGSLGRGLTLATVPIADDIQVINNICHLNAQGGNLTYTGIQQDHHWVTNSVIKNNVCTGTATGVRLSSGVATITGNINADPLFTNAGANDFTLQATSPAKNAGGAAATNPTTDFADNPRPFGVANDCGAFERQS